MPPRAGCVSQGKYRGGHAALTLGRVLPGGSQNLVRPDLRAAERRAARRPPRQDPGAARCTSRRPEAQITPMPEVRSCCARITGPARWSCCLPRSPRYSTLLLSSFVAFGCAKLTRLRSSCAQVTTDIYSDAERQNTQLDDTVSPMPMPSSSRDYARPAWADGDASFARRRPTRSLPLATRSPGRRRTRLGRSPTRRASSSTR
jgi:hypothetical protein